MSEYLTVQEVADRLRVSRMTIYRMCHAGTMPNTRVGSSFRITPSDLERWIKDHTTKRSSDA